MGKSWITVLFITAYVISCGVAAWSPLYGFLLMISIGSVYFVFLSLMTTIVGIVLTIILAGVTLGILPLIMLFFKIGSLYRRMENARKRLPFIVGSIVIYSFFAGVAGFNALPFIVQAERATSYNIWIVTCMLSALGLGVILLIIKVYRLFGYRSSSTALFIAGFWGYMLSLFFYLISLLDIGGMDFDTDADLDFDDIHHHH